MNKVFTTLTSRNFVLSAVNPVKMKTRVYLESIGEAKTSGNFVCAPRLLDSCHNNVVASVSSEIESTEHCFVS